MRGDVREKLIIAIHPRGVNEQGKEENDEFTNQILIFKKKGLKSVHSRHLNSLLVLSVPFRANSALNIALPFSQGH